MKPRNFKKRERGSDLGEIPRLHVGLPNDFRKRFMSNDFHMLSRPKVALPS